MTCPTPLFMNEHSAQPVAETEPREGQHYVYDHDRDEATWIVPEMATTVTSCGKAGRPDDTQAD